MAEDISSMLIGNGRVLVQARPTIYEAGMLVTAGQWTYPFVPLDEPPLLGGVPLRFAVTQGPAGGAEIRVNDLDEWMLDGSITAQIRIVEDDRPQIVKLGAPLVLPANSGRMVFTASLAIHRARASLVLTIAPKGEAAGTKQVIPFDVAKHGGRVAKGYQDVALDIPASTVEQTIAIAVAFQEVLGENDSAYMFVADPRITSLTQTADDSTQVLLNETPAADAQWYEARFDALLPQSKDRIDLVCGEDRLTLYQGTDTAITLQEDFGHSLILSASPTTRVRLRIDGKPQYPTHIGPEATILRLPAACLTGQPSLLELTEPNGMQVLFSTWILPPRLTTPLDAMQKEGRAPFPLGLYPQSEQRYRALRAHLAAGTAPEMLNQLATALTALEAGHDHLDLSPLAFPVHETPDVSIVIPAHNKVNVTFACLCALLLAWNKATFEVILVDDASTDMTSEVETLVSGITVVRNTEPQRFIRACNAGAEKARGRYIVLLNNDTEPTTGWLDALIDGFTRFDRVGLAGSKLVYPDGRLQDAGGIIWGSGNPWNYGHKQNQYDPRYNYARQADYLSGAALMIPREVWNKVGGLSSYLEPMYFEDTDLSFKVREAGFATWFIPSSVVYHYEGMTSGTSTTSGFKRYQEVNRPKFKRRWAKAYAGHGSEGVKPDLEKDRGIVGRVLFIDYATPRPDRDAGSYAAVQEIKLVQSLGFKVTFLPENLAHLGAYSDDLQAQGVELLTSPFVQSLTDYLQENAHQFDAVYITRYHVAKNLVGTIRSANPRAKILLNNADLHFLRQMRAAHADGNADKMAEAELVREAEIGVMRTVDLVLSYTEIEHAVIQSHSQNAVRVMKCPWVVDLPPAPPPRKGRRGLSFLGNFLHFPNVDGAEWVAREVMPAVASVLPGTQLSIYGSGMGDSIRALASPNILPVGFVKDVSQAFDPHLVFLAPLLSGAGIKGKVLGAMAAGIPCVLSPIAAEGIGLRSGTDCLIARSTADWVDAIQRLHLDADLWQAISENARAYVGSAFSFTNARADMRAAFEAVDIFGMTE
ncbi:MAG: glycosyltransferase [Paracoccaceae bacterium]